MALFSEGSLISKAMEHALYRVHMCRSAWYTLFQMQCMHNAIQVLLVPPYFPIGCVKL